MQQCNEDAIKPKHGAKIKTNDCNTSIILSISAERGMHIRLTFLENFHIEVSGDSCDYDFLELRDGPFGYSPLLGRYCGKSPPAIIDTSGRFLWIRFKSDENIEYSGFKIHYVFRNLSHGGSMFMHASDCH